MTKQITKERELGKIVHSYEIPGHISTDKSGMMKEILKWHEKHSKEKVKLPDYHGWYCKMSLEEKVEWLFDNLVLTKLKKNK